MDGDNKAFVWFGGFVAAVIIAITGAIAAYAIDANRHPHVVITIDVPAAPQGR